MIMYNETAKPERKRNGHFARYRQIAMVLAKYRLEEVLRYVGLQNYLFMGWLLRGNPWRKNSHTKPERMRMAIEELGTTAVKLGQILSCRSDLLPPDYITELSKLQNSMHPFPVEIMKNVFNEELGRSTEELFLSFEAPIGIASIGQVYTCEQVYTCTLADGTEVVTKVQKPDVPALVELDVDILKRAAAYATNHWKWAQQYDLVGIVQEISETLKNEMDYIQEGHNAEYFADFFHEDRTIHIPRIFWESTTSRVLTMERIRGIGILDVQSLDKAGFNRKELAKRSVDLWLKMVFESEMFHADPHPGNLFVEADGRLGLIDFGMVYMVDDEVRWHLANVVKAILDRNVDLLIDELIELGAVSLRHERSRDKLRKDLKYIMSHLSKIQLKKRSESVTTNLDNLLSVLRINRIQLPSNTFMLLKTIIMVQGLGKGLDPDFDIVPMLESRIYGLIKKRYSIKSALRRLPSATTELISLVGGLPQRLDRMMKTAERGEIQVQADVSGVEQHIHHLERLLNRAMIVILVSSLILGIALFFVGYRLGL
jgi:ubiquinone biosynthesis protein